MPSSLSNIELLHEASCMLNRVSCFPLVLVFCCATSRADDNTLEKLQKRVAELKAQIELADQTIGLFQVKIEELSRENAELNDYRLKPVGLGTS